MAFQHSLDMGVSTLELDIVLTRDNVPAVWHDPVLLVEKCDLRVGELVHDLTFAELQQVECAKLLPDFPCAEVVEGNRIIALSEVFELAKGYDVHFNIETKIEADHPEMCASPHEFVEAILDTVFAYGVQEKVMIQSFDWRTFPLVFARDPKIPLVALWDETTWHPGTTWGPYTPNIIDAALSNNITVLSPDFKLVDAALIAEAHAHGLRVVPWTVNDDEDFQQLIELGVDGIITDYPARLKEVLDSRGICY